MRIICVTASPLYGTTEVFAIPEVREFVHRRHQVRIVPMVNHSLTPHRDTKPFRPLITSEPLLSAAVVRASIAEFLRVSG